ncbi:MAG: cellulase family glycosylhydrolase [Prolixibacteraceae bacterium]
MKSSYLIFIFAALLCFSSSGANNLPFKRGVNLTNWFQAGSAQQIQFTKYSKTDFEQIQSMGCDVVRLPINLHFMTNGAPDYTIDPLFYSFLDEVIVWTEELGLHLILDNHTFDSATDTDPKVGEILIKVWPQMAAHYLNTSNKIYFEVLNEPHGISDALWNSIQQEVITAIRKVDSKHTIVVGPASWNSYNNLQNMPKYSDDNLIYTFHFYDPFLFTHQGASWTDMTDLTGVPFPYVADKMPAFPASLKGTWIESSYNDYKNTGTITEVHRLIDIADKFQNERNVPLLCGEFGVYDVNSPDEDRTYWYGVVREYLESKNIAWTIWDYHGGFGIYKKGSNGQFYHDMNVPMVENLGLTPPEQTDYIALPDSTGFEIFSDFAGSGVSNSANTTGEMSFYSTDRVNNDQYCISWSNATQYNSITFNFSPDKDLSQLVEKGYALDFIIRGTDPATVIDFRFIDTKTGDDDHPWRNRIVVDQQLMDFDMQWHHLHIPLSTFKEHGSWDNAWYNAEGLFDWQAVDKLEIVAESRPMGEATIWLDNISVTNQDTATVKYFDVPVDTIGNRIADIQSNFATISYNQKRQLLLLQNSSENKVNFKLYHISGKTVLSATFIDNYQMSTTTLKKGLYIIELNNALKQKHIEKIRIQ